MNELPSKTSNQSCPRPNVLREFLQGKLTPPQLDECEYHLENCAQCHETLIGLSSEDTLSEQVSEALQSSNIERESQNDDGSDDGAIKNLLARLTSDQFKQQAIAGSAVGVVESEIMADRAAEVLRCAEPDEDSLGLLGDYSLVRLIGAGSTSVVFQAHDRRLERTVVLKVLRPSLGAVARDRFLAEARSAASIEHGNIVTIFQVGQVDRLAFIAMPWLPGQTLETLMRSKPEMDAEQIVEIISGVAAGLSAAHQRQLVHRDIKPANLWICDADNSVKILDFGLARISDDDPGLTATGMLAGTPNFMSPEQTRGSELDGRSDLFSLGCVLYQLLTGKLPFGAPTVLATLQSIQNTWPVTPVALRPDVPEHLSDLAMCMLEKQPADRPESAEQTRQLFSLPRDQWPITVSRYQRPSAQAVDQTATQKTTPATQSGSGNRVKRGAGWWATGLCLALLGAAGWFWSPQIFRVITDQGEVVIESNDENVEVQVLKDGQVIRVIDTQTQQSFDLKSGQYSFNAVAADKDSDEQNSFSIEPQTLTMKRGETAIVKVTVSNQKKSSVQVSDDDHNSASVWIFDNPFAPKPAKPFFKGKTFAQWMVTAKLDRDPVSRTDALRACTATAETNAEWQELIELTRVLARKHGGMVVGANATSDRYHLAFMNVLDNCELDLVVGFFRGEIKSGTLASREFCCAWMVQLYGDSPSANAMARGREKRWNLRRRLNELTDEIAEHFDQPGVIRLATSLVPQADGTRRFGKQLQQSPLGELLRKRLIEGTLQQRYHVLYLALMSFADDRAVVEVYERDLLDPTLNKVSIKNQQGLEVHGVVVRNDLFGQLLRRSYLTADATDELRLADVEAAQHQLELLVKLTEGILAEGDARLIFGDLIGMGGGYGMDAAGQGYRKRSDEEVIRSLLRTFYNTGNRLTASERKLKILPSLTSIKSYLKNNGEGESPFGGAKQPALQKELDYLIQWASGDSSAKMPENSMFKHGFGGGGFGGGGFGGGGFGGGGMF